MVFNKTDVEEKVIAIIDQLRPFLNDDGGDIKLVGITEEGIVKVQLLGACKECSMNSMTLKAGLEESLKKIAPEITGIIAVDNIIES